MEYLWHPRKSAWDLLGFRGPCRLSLTPLWRKCTKSVCMSDQTLPSGQFAESLTPCQLRVTLPPGTPLFDVPDVCNYAIVARLLASWFKSHRNAELAQ